MAIIDIHTHIYTHDWLELLRTRGGEYGLKVRPDGHEEIFRGDTPVAFPQPGHFDYELRLKHMDTNGIDISIVSLTCPNVYWGDEATSCAAARQTNDDMAAAQTTWPDRIRWFASLPWQYPQQAVRELDRVCDDGASGIMVLANVAGTSLTDPVFEPVWRAIDDRALPVLLHPTDPPGADVMDMGMFDLSWAVGFMFDTTLAVTRMVFEGFFDRFARLKLIASHGGGALPYLVGRFEKGNEVELPERRKMQATPREYLQHIYYDCITYNPGALRYLVSVAGADRVMFGTDWPHQVHDTTGSLANSADLPGDQCTRLRSINATHVFDL